MVTLVSQRSSVGASYEYSKVTWKLPVKIVLKVKEFDIISDKLPFFSERKGMIHKRAV